MKKYIYIFLLLGISILIIIGVAYGPTLLRGKKNKTPEETLNEYINAHQSEAKDKKNMMDLFIDASVSSNDKTQLILFYQSHPEAFDNKEEATIMLLEALLDSGNTETFDRLRKKWKGKETLEQSWLVLDAENLIKRNRREGAINLLESKEYDGPEDTVRLLRLAFYTVNSNPKKALEYLTTAIAKDPQNPDINLYRAKLLESINMPELALSDYMTAIQKAPKNLYFQDQLAEFFKRRGSFLQSLEVWKEALENNSDEFLWLKTFFWNRVIAPIDYDWKASIPSQGFLTPLLDYLSNLKDDEFWDDETFNDVPDGQKYLRAEQATFWLRLLQMLKDGEKQQALGMLQTNPFKDKSWSPQLERMLMQILNYQVNKSFDFSLLLQKSNPLARQSRFSKQLTSIIERRHNNPSYQLPADVYALLNSDYAYTAALLSEGWFEAALDMRTTIGIPKDLPDWIYYGLTEAIRQNRGGMEALKFATAQNPTPPLELLNAEIMISENSQDAALEILSKLKDKEDEVGIRAGWLMGLVYLSKNQPQQAEEIISNNAQLANNILGKELLAKIALSKGDASKASEIYESIQDDSVEAKSFLAEKAFNEKNWKRAKELTVDLLKKYPNNPTFKENYSKIEEEIKKSHEED
ncbi:MAG: hypothetical protein H7A37_00635 [Chlamydiales bacterium]|nr:hypothetical protein [Chlamydiia bacterium]MCP5506798.1 hypothetical protein [Chlamydiales bacterium]